MTVWAFNDERERAFRVLAGETYCTKHEKWVAPGRFCLSCYDDQLDELRSAVEEFAEDPLAGVNAQRPGER